MVSKAWISIKWLHLISLVWDDDDDDDDDGSKTWSRREVLISDTRSLNAASVATLSEADWIANANRTSRGSR